MVISCYRQVEEYDESCSEDDQLPIVLSAFFLILILILFDRNNQAIFTRIELFNRIVILLDAEGPNFGWILFYLCQVFITNVKVGGLLVLGLGLTNSK